MSTEFKPVDPAALDWEKVNGLIPVIIQDEATLRVLMLGYMDRQALETTRSSGKVTFFSRSKKRLWMKGETSGNHLDLVDIRSDCDNDTLLVTVRPHGPTCHTGSTSCFSAAPGNFLGALDALVKQREHDRPQAARARPPAQQLYDQAVREGRAAYRAEGGRGGRGNRARRRGAA